MKILVPVLAIFFTLLALEVGFRIEHYRSLGKDEINFLYLPKVFFHYDEKIGYRYQPNLDVNFTWFVETGDIVRTNHVKTNNHGHVFTRNDEYAKKPGEFRIAIVGDSLSACIHNDLPWAVSLEDLLNEDQKLKNKLGVKSFKVVNLAIDGIGVQQMTAVVENEVPKYKPDLVLVNFITADIYRRFTWRKNIQPDESFPEFNTVLNCTTLPADIQNPDCVFGSIVSTTRDIIHSKQDLARLRKAIAKQVVNKVPWFSLYPQFLSWASRGKLEELLGRNPYHPMTPTIENREESKRVTVEAIRKMKKLYSKTDFLLTPTYWEIIYGAIPALAGEVMDKVPEIPITPMISYLPNVRDQNTINNWTNHPYDMHWSNFGARLYAQAVQKYLQVKYKTGNLYSSNSTQLPYN